jgi:hypothetical protein
MLKFVGLYWDCPRHSYIKTILLPARERLKKIGGPSMLSHQIGVSYAIISAALACHEHTGTSEQTLHCLVLNSQYYRATIEPKSG